MSKESDMHAAGCDANWENQKEHNRGFREDIGTIFNRVRDLELRVAGWAGAGGIVGGIVAILISKFLG